MQAKSMLNSVRMKEQSSWLCLGLYNTLHLVTYWTRINLFKDASYRYIRIGYTMRQRFLIDLDNQGARGRIKLLETILRGVTDLYYGYHGLRPCTMVMLMKRGVTTFY